MLRIYGQLTVIGLIAAAAMIGAASLTGARLGGEVLSFTAVPGPREIYVIDLRTEVRHNISQFPGEDYNPTWSPTGEAVAYLSEREGFRFVYMSDPGGRERSLLTPPDPNDPVDYTPFDALQWSADGKYLYFIRVGVPGDDSRPVRMYRMDYESRNVELVDHQNADDELSQVILGYRITENISPDGALIAHIVNAGGRSRLAVGPIDAPIETLTPLTTRDVALGTTPAWSANSRYIAFETLEEAERRIYVLDVVKNGLRDFRVARASQPRWRP